MKASTIAALAMLCQSASAFSTIEMKNKRMNLALEAGVSSEGDSRRDFFSKSTSAAIAAASGLGQGVLAPLPANAVGGLDKVNSKLRGYGLPPVSGVPGGFTPLAELWGRGKNRFPLLVVMNHPLSWVVTLPSNDVNGEDGTVQAGEYAKGDTATFYVNQDEGHVNSMATQDKALVERTLIKAISQKGANIYQDFKVTRFTPQTGPEYNGKEYITGDFKYTLLTGAGFEVERRGVFSMTSEGPAVEVLWAASTRERFKKTEQTLRDITGSFRVYGDGLNFSDDLYDGQALFN